MSIETCNETPQKVTTILLDAQDLSKFVTLKVEVKPVETLSFRIRRSIGIAMIQLGARVVGVNVTTRFEADNIK